MTTAPLGTDTDIFIEVFPRNAGIESGRFYGTWHESTFKLGPNAEPARSLKTGIKWEVFFKALDEENVVASFHGYAETRRSAKLAITDKITKHVFTISELRKKYPFLSTEEALLATAREKVASEKVASEKMESALPAVRLPHSVPDVVIKDMSWRWKLRSWRWKLRAVLDRILRWFRR